MVKYLVQFNSRDTVTRAHARVSRIKTCKVQPEFFKLKRQYQMASTGGGRHGGKRVNSDGKRYLKNIMTEKDI